MRVEKIMKTEVKTVGPEEAVADVARQMVLNRIAGVPVVEQGALVGIVSEKDILRAMYPTYQEFVDSPVNNMDFEQMEGRYREVGRTRVRDIMTSKIVSVTPETPILKASSLMILKKIRRLPVLDTDGRLVGIVSQGDVHMAIFADHFMG